MVLIKQVTSAWLEKLSTLIYEARTPLRGGVSQCPVRVGVHRCMTLVQHLSE
jgi:hypothetical protein